MKLKLVEDWKQSWKWASVQLAAIAAIVAGILAANPGLVLGLIGYLPEGNWRTIASMGVSFIVFVVPALARIIENCREKPDGK